MGLISSLTRFIRESSFSISTRTVRFTTCFAGACFFQDGNTVVIEVRDDGNGIDSEAVKNKAIERGTITPDR